MNLFFFFLLLVSYYAISKLLLWILVIAIVVNIINNERIVFLIQTNSLVFRYSHVMRKPNAKCHHSFPPVNLESIHQPSVASVLVNMGPFQPYHTQL